MKKKVAQKKNYADVWPPVIDRGDIGWEIAIVLLAAAAAIFASSNMLQVFLISLIALAAMTILYVWTHAQKHRER